MKKMIPTLIALLGLAACGTDTGNPFRHSNTNDPQAEIGSPVGEWSEAMCGRLQACLPGVPADCAVRVETASSITAVLGLDVALYPDLSSVSRAVASGALRVDDGESTACRQAVRELPCGHVLVQQSFDPDRPDDFTSVHRLLSASPSCQRMIR